MFGTLKLKQKVFAGFLSVGLVTTAIAAISYVSFDNVLKNFKGFVEYSNRAELNLLLAHNVSEIQRQALIYTYEGHQSAAEQVHALYGDMKQTLEKGESLKSDHADLIQKHIHSYMQAFEQLQQQRELQHHLIHFDLKDAAANAEHFLQLHIQQQSLHHDNTELLMHERILNSLLSIEKYALRYFNTLDPSYIQKTKAGFITVRKQIQAMKTDKQRLSAGTESTNALKNIETYERTFLEAVQRTRGYLFLVNVVMSAEAYEILYNARKMSDQVTQEMTTIEQDTLSTLQQLFNYIIIALLLSLLMVLLLSVLIGRSLTKPIMGLTKAFNALSQGSHKTEIPPYQANDEIGDLTRAAVVFKEKNLQTHTLLEQAKALTQELKKSQEKYVDLYDNAPDMYASVEAATALVLQCNQTVANKLGYRKDEMIGQPIFALYHADCMDKVQAAFKSFIETGVVHNAELQLRKKDGSKIEVNLNVTSVRDENGQILHSRSSWIDITDRKQAEEKVRKLSQAVDQSGEAVAITDAAGCIEYINPAFSLITGYSEAEAIGQNPRILKSGNQDAAFYEKMWSTLRSGEFWQSKVINKRKNGDFYPSMLTISPIKNDSGKITNYIGIQQSLEAIEALEAQFHQSQKMEAIGTLVGGIAHDFNNNLAGITGNLYLAKMAAKSLPEVVKRLDSVETLSFGAAATIQQLLAFSRKGIVQMNPLSISSFLKETIKLQQVSLPESVSLQLQVNDTDMLVKGDINQLQQVLMNLINNAFDAVQKSENPAIRICLDRFQADDDFVTQHNGYRLGEYARISVVDNGSGIKPEHLNHVFEPFFTTKEQGKGTGLGLAMVYGAVKTHDGMVDIISSLQGTTVQLCLPLIMSGEAIDIAVQEDQVVDGDGEMILLVDDNKTVLKTAKDVLEGINYVVLTAEDGLAAIETYQSHINDIDLVILDVVMPRLGGVEALKMIKDINPDVKAMFATGYDKLRTLGVNQQEMTEKVISKPFAVSKLSQLIREVLRG